MSHNSISESNHAAATFSLKTGGTIRIDHSCAEGQTRMNKDFNRGHMAMVTGKVSTSGTVDLVQGTYHHLRKELKESLVEAARKNVKQTRKWFDDAMKNQREKRQRVEEIAMERKLDAAMENFIVAIYFWEQYDSPRCWKTVDKATSIYRKLKTPTAKLRAVKEQILIRYLGLGWIEAHHPWSKAGLTFSPDELFQHLIEKVIPLSKNNTVPDKPPSKLPSPPEMYKLGTTADIDMTLGKYADRIAAIEEKGYAERDIREEKGEGDRWTDRQELIAPEINNTLIGYKIEMLFEYIDIDGSQLTNWYHGKVTGIKNERTNAVIIEWDQECLGEGDQKRTVEKLLPTKYNPDGPKQRAWRQYLQ